MIYRPHSLLKDVFCLLLLAAVCSVCGGAENVLGCRACGSPCPALPCHAHLLSSVFLTVSSSVSTTSTILASFSFLSIPLFCPPHVLLCSFTLLSHSVPPPSSFLLLFSRFLPLKTLLCLPLSSPSLFITNGDKCRRKSMNVVQGLSLIVKS